jgi:3-methylcrotonyl-CoA carboxylase beta subunit
MMWMWPNARISVMGGDQAALVLSTVKEDGLKLRGEEWPENEKADYEDMIRAQYENQGNPLYASGRLWDDGVIDPVDTRRVLAHGLSAAMNHPQPPESSFGIFRM